MTQSTDPLSKNTVPNIPNNPVVGGYNTEMLLAAAEYLKTHPEALLQNPNPQPLSNRKIIRYETGSPYKLYEGETLNEKWHGRGVLYYIKGDKYDGEFKEGKIHGQGVYTWANGRVYSGAFENGVRQGYGQMTTETGQTYNGQYINDEYQFPKAGCCEGVCTLI